MSADSHESRLTLHWENGFTLTNTQSGYEEGRTSVIWHYPFEKLRMSSDDGKRLLWLDFGEEDGEKVTTCPFMSLLCVVNSQEMEM